MIVIIMNAFYLYTDIWISFSTQKIVENSSEYFSTGNLLGIFEVVIINCFKKTWHKALFVIGCIIFKNLLIAFAPVFFWKNLVF
jgi:hypothetical protein